MKSQEKWAVGLLLIAGIVAGFVFSRSVHTQSSSPKTAAVLNPAAAPESKTVSGSEVSRNSRVGTESAVPLDSAKASVRRKLQQWRETQTEDEESRVRLLEELMALLTKDNAEELSRALSVEELNSPFGLAAQKLWLEVDPRTASRWIVAQPEATEEQARLVAWQYLADDIGLKTFCNELPETAWRERFLSVASLEMVGSAPARAAELTARMKPGPAQANAVETVVYDWATHDLNGAIGLVEGMTDPALKEKALVMTAKAIAVGDPDLGAQWLAAAVKSEGALKDAAQCVVAIWAEKSPADAAQWLSRVSDPVARSEAVGVLARAWVKTDATSAQAWIQTLPEKAQVLAMLKADEAERKQVQE